MKPRLAWQVGLFVALALALAAGLVLKFSKGPSVFAHTYPIYLRTTDVGGIRKGAAVYMAGVQIGFIDDVHLDAGGRTVTLRAQIFSQYPVFERALVSIQQAGFLGDQYIAIQPGPNPGPQVKPGAELPCAEPFNLQEVARASGALVLQVERTLTNLDVSITRVNATLLSDESLTNLEAAVGNVRQASDGALRILNRVNSIVETNSHPLSITVSNLAVFSDDLNRLASELQEIVATNRVEITAAVKNIEAATLDVDKVLADLQAGTGLAGSLLKDRELEAQFKATMENLTVASSNLAHFGILYRPKRPRKPPPPMEFHGRTPE